MLTRLKCHWGQCFFVFISLFCLITVFRAPVGGHYMIFSGAAQALWSGINPYGQTFGSNAGFWLYSPSCGLFFYSLFNLFPPQTGQFLYMLCSWLLLVWGLIRFSKVFYPHLSQWFWFIGASELIGAMLNTRTEVAILGILLGAAPWVLNADWRKQVVGLFLWAMICNWKFQSLPSIGLVLLGLFFVKRNTIVSVLVFLLSLAFWYLLPFLFLTKDLLLQAHQDWASSMHAWMISPYRDFQNWQSYQQIYGFLRKVFGIDISLSTANSINLVIGLGLALWMWQLAKKIHLTQSATSETATPATTDLNVKTALADHYGNSTAVTPTTAIAFQYSLIMKWGLALGAAYSNAFLPLSQSSAYISYLPLLALAFDVGIKPVVLFLSWFFVSLAYSDITPKALRLVLVDASVKPIGILILLFGLLLAATAKNKRTVSL